MSGVNHEFEVGDFALDNLEPTPSPEANTVLVLELTNKRADEYIVEETGKTVLEHNDHYWSQMTLLSSESTQTWGVTKNLHFQSHGFEGSRT